MISTAIIVNIYFLRVFYFFISSNIGEPTTFKNSGYSRTAPSSNFINKTVFTEIRSRISTTNTHVHRISKIMKGLKSLIIILLFIF